MSLDVGDGQVSESGRRVVVLDVARGFLALRRAMENALGDVTAVLLYNAGLASYGEVASSGVSRGVFTRDADGFRAAVAAYRRAGFGGFEVLDVEYGAGSARLRCVEPIAFEAHGVLERRDGEMKPACDYTRGALAGMMGALKDRKDLLCIETECRAKGDAQCLFEIGGERALTAKLLRA